ncbi:peptidoglycan-binding domain-containing protein [Streptomyces sp. NPDC126499]|uniref:peptidoglycan-binding domain-containing protein n=1 Tax=Streptomyces sp. NPDC126499 TaxID=3155314 RepID=UPI00332A8F75
MVAAAVVGTAVLATALIGGDDSDTDDRALVPEVTTSASENVAVSEAPTTTRSPSGSTSATAPAEGASGSASPAAMVSSSPSSAAGRTSATAGAPAAAPSATGAPTSASPPPLTPTPTPTRAPEGPTLRPGSTGPEVEELQWRLRQLGLYAGPVNGSYSRKVEQAVATYQRREGIAEDPVGVYGPYTRRALEAETTEW